VIVLIFGLPGSGKTTLAKTLTALLPSVTWFNADEVRARYNDWDFSPGGRLRQVERMRKLAGEATTDVVICDFVAPTEAIRNRFAADLLVWVDTITESRYADTNDMFEPPIRYDVRVTTKDAHKWATKIKC
jgi:adenylylsulfate kinase-like enzyme